MNRSLSTIWICVLVVGVGLLAFLSGTKMTRPLEAPRSDASESDSLRSELAAEQARRAQGEVERLNAIQTIAELREKLGQFEGEATRWHAERETTRQEIASLKQSLATAAAASSDPQAPRTSSGAPASNPGNSPTEQERFEAYLCANHLLQLAKAATQWADTHDDAAPPDFLSLQEYLAPMILVCPSARSKSFARHWKEFDPASITYLSRLDAWPSEWRWRRGISRVFAECPLHHTMVMNPAGTGGPLSTGIPSKYVR